MNIKKVRRLKKRLKFIMFLSTVLLFTSPLCADEATKEEEITLSTYYPAPYGEYEGLQADRLQANNFKGNSIAVGSETTVPSCRWRYEFCLNVG